MKTIETRTKILSCVFGVAAMIVLGNEYPIPSAKERDSSTKVTEKVLFDYRREKMKFEKIIIGEAEDFTEKKKEYGVSKIKVLKTRPNIYSVNPIYKN